MSSARPRPGSIPLRVHEPSEVGFSGFAAIDPRGLTGSPAEVLARLCRDAARLLDAEVVSVYGRQRGPDGDDLLMLGNVGFPETVVGNLLLRVGDGIVGMAAECMRTISVAKADRDPSFKPVRGVDETQVPVLLAVPLVRAGRCQGVLVFQRATRLFSDPEIRLAQILGEGVALVLAAAAVSGDGTPSGAAATLGGRVLSHGFAIGRVELLPTAESLDRLAAPPPGPAALQQAMAKLARDLLRGRERLGTTHRPALARVFDQLDLLLGDARFAERIVRAGATGIVTLARDYARVPYRLAGRAGSVDPTMVQRARDIEELCVLIHLTATGSRLRDSGRVWVGERLGGFFAVAAARSATAVVLDGAGEVTDDALLIARAAGLPVMTDVTGLFASVRGGDLVVVDADRGRIRINPSATGLAEARAPRAAVEEADSCGRPPRPGR